MTTVAGLLRACVVFRRIASREGSETLAGARYPA